jgi:hypothetical protein
MKVENLFEDIKDGVYLLSLLEALSGEKLVSNKPIGSVASTGGPVWRETGK